MSTKRLSPTGLAARVWGWPIPAGWPPVCQQLQNLETYEDYQPSRRRAWRLWWLAAARLSGVRVTADTDHQTLVTAVNLGHFRLRAGQCGRRDVCRAFDQAARAIQRARPTLQTDAGRLRTPGRCRMSEPTCFSMWWAAGVSVATCWGLVGRLYRRLPRWRRRPIVSRVVDYSAVRLRDDMWVVAVGDTTYLSTSKVAMEELLDRLELGDQVAAQRVPWPGRPKGGV